MSKDYLALLREKKANIQAQSGRRERTTRFAPGKNIIRILPSWKKDGGQFWHDFGQHYVKGGDGQLKAVYICANKTHGKQCAICDGLQSAINMATDDTTINLLKEANATQRILVNALNRTPGSENPNAPVILELSPTTFEKVIDVIETWSEDGVDALDLKAGIDFIVTRSGKGLNTEYSVQPAPKSAPVDPSVLSSLHDLDAFVAQESEQERNRALTAVHAVVGLLPAASDKPATGGHLSADFDDSIEFASPEKVIDAEIIDGKAAPTAEEDDELNKLLEAL